MYILGDISAEELFRMFFGDSLKPGTVMYYVKDFSFYDTCSCFVLFGNFCLNTIAADSLKSFSGFSCH